MDVIERLTSLLKQSGMSRYRLAKNCDIAEETLTGIFNRGNIPTIATLETICGGLGITLSQFFAEGDMVVLSSEYEEFYKDWQFLTTEQKSLIIQLMREIRSKNSSNK